MHEGRVYPSRSLEGLCSHGPECCYALARPEPVLEIAVAITSRPAPRRTHPRWYCRTPPRWRFRSAAFEGRSTCYLIENCSKTAPVEIYCVDTWEGGVEHDKNAMGEVERRFDHNVTIARRRAPHAASVSKLKKASTQALAEILARPEAPFDLIYVDGSHQAPDVLTDAVLAFQFAAHWRNHDL
jgi:hypothetical protein